MTSSTVLTRLAAPVLRRERARQPEIGALATVADPERLVRVTRVHPVLVGRLTECHLRGQRVLEGVDRTYLARLVADAVDGAATGLGASDPDAQAAAGVALENRVTYVAAFVSRREGEIARRRYAEGLGWGVLASVAVLLVVGAVAPVVIRGWLGATDIGAANRLALRDTLVAIGGGAAGAAVSVLLRLSRVPDLKIETVRASTAMVRILLGWFFAVAVLALVKGGIAANLMTDPSAVLLNADPTDDTAAVIVGSWYFWAAVGFLAGFNERWATTIIARDPGAPVVPATPPASPTP